MPSPRTAGRYSPSSSRSPRRVRCRRRSTRSRPRSRPACTTSSSRTQRPIRRPSTSTSTARSSASTPRAPTAGAGPTRARRRTRRWSSAAPRASSSARARSGSSRPASAARPSSGRSHRVEHGDFRDKSYWLTTRAYEPGPPLPGDRTVDVAIVGGGYTGLSTALEIRRARPDLSVAVLEAEVVGFGASGRNGGFAMTLFGLDLAVTAARFGDARAAEAHRHMRSAVDAVGELVGRERIDCDYTRGGLLVVGFTRAHVERLESEVEHFHRLGFGDIELWDGARVRAAVDSPRYLGAKHDPFCAVLNPAKLCWGLRDAAVRAGATVYERTPVAEVRLREDPIRVVTPHGTVRAGKLVLATNAFSRWLPALHRKAAPVFTYVVMTEPLDTTRLGPIGWKGRQGIEDARNLVHYYRLTADDRLVMGGGAVNYFRGGLPGADLDERIHADLEAHARWLFPSLEGVRFTHRWGGPVSVPLDMAPALGTLGDGGRVFYSLGCVGHGVSLSIKNGEVLRDLVLGEESDLTRLFFVNRRVVPFPPEPLRWVLAHAIRDGLVLHDRWAERGVRQGPGTG
ncbi:MAG: FAD-dependent oxidoreductase [Deltaproteobacteria bacterium]|nr:FAD-dependent oxidoreductase [Deltaproteobacteria bacterium]